MRHFFQLKHWHRLEDRIAPAVFTVTTLSDSGPGSLRDAVATANQVADADTITFSESLFPTPQPITLITGSMGVNHKLDIIGPGADLLTLQGNGSDRHFFVGSGSLVTISGVTLSGGRRTGADTNGRGGSIEVDIGGQLALSDCVVRDNATEYYGGAIFVEGITQFPATLSVSNCRFENNRVLNTTGIFFGGGAFSIDGNVTAIVEDCQFIDNRVDSTSTGGGSGGAIFADTIAPEYPVELTIRRSQFTGNRTQDNGGGAIMVEDHVTTLIEDCVFANNLALKSSSSRGFGGAVTVLGTNKTTMLRNHFLNNSSSFAGGAVSFQKGATSSEWLVADCLFEGNSSQLSGGGGIALGNQAAALLKIRNTTMTSNSGLSGGAIRLTGTFLGSVSLFNSTIVGNSATNSGAGVVVEAGTLSAVSSIIANNNSGTNGDVSGIITANKCVIGATDGATINGLDNFTGSKASPFDPELGPFQFNGGAFKSFAPIATSPIVDMGGNPDSASFDQRGPGFERLIGTAPDIGAIEYQVNPPLTVAKLDINDGSPQRSLVTVIRVTFSEMPRFPNGHNSAFELLRTGPGGPTGPVLLRVVPETNVVTLTFRTGGAVPLDRGSLIDGLYQLRITATDVIGAAGPLDGNADGTVGDDYLLTGTPANGLFRLFGDADGNGSVSAVDFNGFRLAFGTAGPSPFDFDGDNQVTAADFNQFRLRYGVTLTP